MDTAGVQREIAFQGCSAVTGDGIWEGIGRLQEIMENYNTKTTAKASDTTGISKMGADSTTGNIKNLPN